MKVLIDIPDDVYRHITEDDVFVYTARANGKTFVAEMLKAIENGLALSDNATNGDVIKAIFPKAIYDDEYISVVEMYIEQNQIRHDFDKDWWNAPYKAESEEV